MSSLALVQGYSSDEEEDRQGPGVAFSDSESEEPAEGSLVQDEEEPDSNAADQPFDPSLFPSTTTSSSLPSAAMVFSEVTGPPDYLKDSAGNLLDIQAQLRSKKSEEAKKNTTSNAVVEAKPQPSAHDCIPLDESWKLPADEAAKRLGVCQSCNVPKTYSAARECLVCPVCKDRPDADRKRGSKIKDKEKSKRMRGQSSHATWKTETEMQMRQQFD